VDLCKIGERRVLALGSSFCVSSSNIHCCIVTEQGGNASMGYESEEGKYNRTYDIEKADLLPTPLLAPVTFITIPDKSGMSVTV
jgi:hypothetical protein